jgi:mediator of RNA polymerase II transcription subunit 12
MLAALTDRLKGMSHALSGLGGLETSTSQAPSSSVVELYAWYSVSSYILKCKLTQLRLTALLRLVAAHGPQSLRDATHLHQAALMLSLQAIFTHATLELFPSIVEHVFDVATILSDHISDDVRNQFVRLESGTSTNLERACFIHGAKASIDGWLMLTKPVISLLDPSISQPSTPNTTHSQSSPYQSPQMTPNPGTPQHRYFNQQHQRQQSQQSQQAQQMRPYPQYTQHAVQPNRQLPAQLQRTHSLHASPSPLQQMQHMQQLQGLAQQRVSQPSPIHSQRSTPAAGSSGIGGLMGGNAASSKTPISHALQQRDMRQHPFIQPRWEILAESSGNPNLNETAINLNLFGARRV